MTEETKAYNKQYLKSRREWLHEHHLCVDCKKQDALTLIGKCRCYECKEKARIRRNGHKLNKQQRTEIGLCHCGKPIKKGYKVCEDCYNHMCEMSKISHRNDGEGKPRIDRSAYHPPFPRSEWIEHGYCYICGAKQLDGYKVCAKCRERLIKKRYKQKELGQDYLVRKGVENLFTLRKAELKAKREYKNTVKYSHLHTL